MDGVRALHEITQHIYTLSKEQIGIVAKSDFEKAYDKVNRFFSVGLLQT
jgi:hypothetical protein